MYTKLKFLLVFLGCVHSSFQNKCTSNLNVLEEEWTTWHDIQLNCSSMLLAQIQMELKASITYLAMSAHFSHYQNHRPGIAKFFLESAIEERSHAKKLLEYLLMRGGEQSITSSVIKTIVPELIEDMTMREALELTIKTEKEVTGSIKKIISICGGEEATIQTDNDYHAVDYLTGEFLTEQYESIRVVVGHLSTLRRLGEQYGKFAEVIFDKTLSTGGV